MATCVECDEEITIGRRPRLGMKVICGYCGAHLEVVSLDPLELDWADEDDEDEWDSTDGFDDEPDLYDDVDDGPYDDDDFDDDDLD